AARTHLHKASTHTVRKQTFYQIVEAASEEGRGRNQQALRIAERGRDNTYPSFKMTVLAQRVQTKGQARLDPTAITALYEQFDQAGSPPHYYSDLISMAARTGDTGLQVKISAACLVSNVEPSDGCLSREKKDEKAKQTQGTSDPGVVGTFLGLFN